MDFSRYPKIELHCHLDCSLSYEVVKKLDPKISIKDYAQFFIGPTQFPDLAGFLHKAKSAIQLMQNEEQLRMVTADLFRQWKNDNVIYGEMRFAPFEHIMGGLEPQKVVEIVNNAVDILISEYGIEVRIILCTLRHYPEHYSMATVKLVNKFKGSKVVGFDIASDEAGFPIDAHLEAFKFAKAHDIPCTAHAGEAKGPESIVEILDHFSPARIGHGVRCVEDTALMDRLKIEKKHLEICPSSNVQTNIYDHLSQHPVNRIYCHGISCGINTDNRTITNITLEEEYQNLHQFFGWGKDDFLHANLEAINHAFVEAEVKDKIKARLELAWKN